MLPATVNLGRSTLPVTVGDKLFALPATDADSAGNARAYAPFREGRLTVTPAPIPRGPMTALTAAARFGARNGINPPVELTADLGAVRTDPPERLGADEAAVTDATGRGSVAAISPVHSS